MATINLGRVKPVFRGAYAGGTAYVVDDIVTYSNETYICILASTGNLPTDTTYWTKLAAKGVDGTDGTDLTTTLTTQGDILYRDGSGIQRLGAGTAGQVLQTGGTGANPSWGTVSSEMVKLATINASGTSSITFDGYFSSTYDTYELRFNGFRPSTDSHIAYKLRTGNADISAGYYGGHGYHYTDLNATNSGSTIRSAWNSGYQKITEGDTPTSNTTSPRTHGVITIRNPLVTGSYHFIQWTEAHTRSGNDILFIDQGAGWCINTTNALSGITIFSENGNIANGTFRLYGIK